MGPPHSKPKKRLDNIGANGENPRASALNPQYQPIGEPATRVVIHATHDYEAQDSDGVSFRKFDIMYLIDNSDDVWWLVELESTKKKGYVPCNHVSLGKPRKKNATTAPPDPAKGNNRQTPAQNDDRRDSRLGARNNNPGSKIVIALYDYTARTAEDLTFAKHDRMELIDDSDIDWWFVKHCTNGEEGYVPSNYITIDDSLTKFDWFMKVLRFEATRMISADSNPDGTFLVRESETQKGVFTLSIKFSAPGGGPKVKHYRIHKAPNGSYYIAENEKFFTLEALINFYRGRKGGICCMLTNICSKPLPVTSGLAHELKDHWEIERRTLDLGKLLGKGNFGEVYQGLWNGATPVAIKTLKPGSMSTEAFLLEAKVMKECKHDNLVQLFAVCTTKEPIYIVTELMSNGSLRDHLMKKESKTFGWEVLMYMAAQVAEGMVYLSQKPLIHRDLAARNVLVGERNLCKIADFGMARLITDGDYIARKGSKFPVKWTAPEALSHRLFSVKSDVWSFGILMIEIATFGGVPYPTKTNAEVIDEIGRGARHEKPNKCPGDIYEIMKSCWCEEPEERPAFEDILQELNGYLELVDCY